MEEDQVADSTKIHSLKAVNKALHDDVENLRRQLEEKEAEIERLRKGLREAKEMIDAEVGESIVAANVWHLLCDILEG
jgi:predicted RNase H-like nuclease (RuvC/YqgF family)